MQWTGATPFEARSDAPGARSEVVQQDHLEDQSVGSPSEAVAHAEFDAHRILLVVDHREERLLLSPERLDPTMPEQAARCGALHSAPAGADSGSLMTRPWREPDSNRRSPPATSKLFDCAGSLRATALMVAHRPRAYRNAVSHAGPRRATANHLSSSAILSK